MARDYKNAGRGKHKKTLPGWVWMVSGLAIGLFVALLVYLDGRPRGERPSARPSISVSSPQGEPAASRPDREDTPAPPRFDFYTLLPELEVVIPEDDYTVSEESGPGAHGTPTPVETAGSFVLQVGSFKQYQEADRLKASLALLGVQAHIQKVEVNNDIWHRVRLGPYTQLADVNALRKRLRAAHIDTILLKVRE